MSELIQLFGQGEMWAALISLVVLEIILGIDNIVFIAVLSDRLPEDERPLAYKLGLGGALVTRLLLLGTISWVTKLKTPLFTLLGAEISWRSLILIAGGVFLVAKSTHEIYEKVEHVEDDDMPEVRHGGLWMTVLQIAILDIIFSLDSVITAVGMVDELSIMVIAVIIAVVVMLLFARPVGEFVNRHPSMKVLALSFLMLIGVVLTADGIGQHISKGYIYSAMAFSLLVELVNMRFRSKRKKK